MSLGRSCHINEGVLFDILLCLPAMSLLRFKAVCKDWFSLIESSFFISEHINHHRDSTDDSLIVWSHVNDEPTLVLLSGREYEKCDFGIENWQSWHPASAATLMLIGHCNGIVCLSYDHEAEIALWNPVLKQLRPLPPSLFVSPKYNIKIAFGVDIKGNSYKVARIGLEYRKNTRELIGNRVEVYSLAGDNSWRITHLDDVLPFDDIVSSAVSSSKSGMCFWIAHRQDFGEQMLLSFDFNEDLFKVMSLPHVPNGDFIRGCELDLLGDKVVCIVEIFCWVNLDVNFEIWMLDEFGVKDSWNKIYKIGPMVSYDSMVPLGISKNGEFLICCKQVIDDEVLAGDGHKIYLYNLHTQQGMFPRNCNFDLYLWNIIHYNASLLSLKTVDNVVSAT